MLNTQPVLTIQLLGFTSNNGVTRSRSALVNLNVGDQLYVTFPTAGCFIAGYFRQFLGFKLIRLYNTLLWACS
jgi:hypothetical protein